MVKGDYEKAMQYTKQVLDDIDIKQIASEHPELKSISDLVTFIEDEYDQLANNEYMHGFIFNWMNHEEFIDYLDDRYGDSFRPTEVTVTYINFV